MRIALLLVCFMSVACDDEPDEAVIGRADGGGAAEVVRRWEFSVSFPEGSMNNSRAFHASLTRMRQVTCLDDDENAEDDLYCPVTFAHSERVAKPVAGDLEGLFEAAEVLAARGTTVTLINKVAVPEIHLAGWTLIDEQIFPEAFQRLIPGGIKYGIVINGSVFDNMRAIPGIAESDVRDRLGEAIVHEFGHLAGSKHIAKEAERTLFMHPDLLPDASEQQFLINREQCEAFYLSDALENDQIQGLDNSMVTRRECL